MQKHRIESFLHFLLFRNSTGVEKHLNFAENWSCGNAQIIKIYRCSKEFEYCRKLSLPQQKNHRNRIDCHKNHSQASGFGHGHGYGMAIATAVVVRCCHTIAMATSMAIAMAQAKGTAAIALAMAMAVAIGTATAMDMPMAMIGHRYGHGTNGKNNFIFSLRHPFLSSQTCKNKGSTRFWFPGSKPIKNQSCKHAKTKDQLIFERKSHAGIL